MKAIVITIVALTIALVGFAQKRSERKAAFNSKYNYEINVAGVGIDRTKVYKVWGYGKKVEDAILNAKRSAVAAAIFKDIPGCPPDAAGTPALCKESNAAEVHADYFNAFFAYNGPWRNYVNLTSDGVPSGKNRLKMKDGYKVGIIVQLLYDNLRKDLEEAGVVKKLDNLF